jgi:apolipoprotein N-acyltransferase
LIWVRIIVTMLAASSHALMVAPYDVHWLAWVAYVPMFWVIRADTPRANRWLSFLYGTTSVFLIFRWLADTLPLYSNVPWIGSAGLLVLFAAAFGLPWVAFWPVIHRMRARLGWGWLIVAPSWWVVIEWVSMRVLLFPYNQGITQHSFLPLFQMASIVGVYGLTWLVFVVNCVLAEAVYRRVEGRGFPVLATCAAVSLVSTCTLYGGWRYEQVESALRSAPVKRIGQLQEDMTMPERLEMGGQQAFYRWLNRTDQIPRGAVDLVVWPEGGSPYHLNQGKAPGYIGKRAKAGDFWMVVGGGTSIREKDAETQEWKKRVYNTVYSFDSEGQIAGYYHKLVPLAFGEYLPGARMFPFLRDIIEGPGDFYAGDEATVLEVDGIRVAAPICYEVILAHVCRRFDNPDLLINVTNDGWFGPTDASYLHGMLAEARAVELGIPLFRSAYTGTSFIAEPHGVVHSRAEAFTSQNNVVYVRMGKFKTLYGRFGDWFVLLCLFISVAGAVRSRQ